MRVLRPDARVVEPRGYGVRGDDLSVLVVHHVRSTAVEHAGRASVERRGVATLAQPLATRLDADHVHFVVVHEREEEAHGVGAAADARDQQIRQTPFRLSALLLGLFADHRLEVAHQHRIGMRPGDAADDVVRIVHPRHPVAHGLVHGVLERLRTRRHRNHVGTEQFHAIDVDALAGDVLFAHVDLAPETQARGHRGRRDPVLPGPRLRDDARLAHARRQHRLADGVVDFVRPGVVEILALEIDARPARVGRQPLRRIERRRSPDIAPELLLERGAKVRIPRHRLVEPRQLVERVHERLRHEAAAVVAETSQFVGGVVGGAIQLRHGRLLP